MEEKLRIIELIKSADISKDFWSYEILDTIQNKYAKGYLSAKLSELNESLCEDQEYWRKDFLSACEHNIWNEE